MKRRSIFILIGIGLIVFSIFVMGANSLKSYSGNFFEGFESGAFATNGWSSSGGVTTNWVVSTDSAYSGTYLAYASNTDAESILSTGINASGYGNISFSFWYSTSGLDSGEYLRADWYNGTNWITILDLTNTNVAYTLANFSLPSSASNNEDFAIRFRCNVNLPNEACRVDDISVLGKELLGINLVDIYLLNQDGERISELNNTAAETSDLMVINFSVNHLDEIDSWYLNFSANGSNACALGNKQSSACYSYPNWIQFINGTETETFDASKESQSDYVRAYLSEGETSNFSFIIDEHYNPNVFKWYESQFNFSDEKWLNETQYRIGGDNMIKIEVNSSIIPLDMDFARVDLRVNYSGTPEKLEMFACNSSLVNQDPYIYSGCQLIGEMEYFELYEDRTKFKAFFSKNLVDLIGDLKYIVLHSESIDVDDYYYIKIYGVTNEDYSIHWQYSNDYGVTWNTSDERYATQLNVNWFYNGNDPTAFVYRFWANTTSGYEKYFEGNLTWDVDPVKNYPPLLIFSNPEPLPYFSIPHNMSFIIADTNNDPLNVSMYLYQNETLNKTIFSGENETISEYYCDDAIDDGFYTLLLKACEINTTELYCRNSTREIAIDNNFPVVLDLFPLENGIYYDNVTNEIEISANVSDLSVKSVVANITYPTGVVEQINLTNELGDKYNASFEIPLIGGRYNVTIIATDYLDNVNDSETTYFVLNDVSSPSVILEHPFGNNFYNNNSIEISANIMDSSDIDSIIATILFPNASSVNLTDFVRSIETDSFNNNTMNYIWEFRNDSVAEGQECYADINTEIEGSLFLNINGTGVSGTSACGISSLDKLDGDYDIYVDFNVISMESDSIFVFRVGNLRELYSSGRRLFVSLRQVDSQKYYRFGYMNGTELIISQISTNDFYGKLRIKRYNSSEGNYLYDAYYFDNQNNIWIKVLDAVSISDSSRTQHAQIYLESLGNDFGKINVSVNEFNVQSSDNYFALFNPYTLEGIYNVTMFVNDSYGNINNTEETWFNLSVINTAPSNPIIYHPSYGEYFSGNEKISWSKVIDSEGDLFRFNISLLNLDYSLNSTIVSNYGNLNSVDYLWNTSGVLDGEYKIRVVAYENETVEGYSSNSSDFVESFFVDNTLPEVEFLNGTTDSGTYSIGEINFNVSFSDLNLNNAIVYLYSQSSLIDFDSSNVSSFSGNFSELSSGTYYLNATAYDLAGNFKNTETRTIVVSLPVDEDSRNDVYSSSGGIFVVSEKMMVDGFSKNLFNKNKLRFYLNNEIHTLEIISINESFVGIKVYSDVFENVLSVGNVWKIDLNNDSFYDLEISVNSINDAKIVNLTLKKISEEFVEVQINDGKILPISSEFEEVDKSGFFRLTGEAISEFFSEGRGYWVLGILVFLGVLYFVFRKMRLKKDFEETKIKESEDDFLVE